MRIVSQASLADMFGVTAKTIDVWQDQGLPIALRGGANRASEYEAAECIQWLVSREVAKVRAESPKDRLYSLQAEEVALRLAEKRGTMIPAAEIEPAMKAAMIAAREYLRSIPPQLAVLLAGAEPDRIESELRSAFDEFLTRMSQWRPSDQVDAEADDDDEEGDERGG